MRRVQNIGRKDYSWCRQRVDCNSLTSQRPEPELCGFHQQTE